MQQSILEKSTEITIEIYLKLIMDEEMINYIAPTY